MFSIIIILAVNVILYAKTLRLGYVCDDIPTHQNPPKMNNKWHKYFCWIIGSYKHNTYLDHFLTLIIHALVGCFIYTAFGSNHVSFIAALLFSANPANNQGSVWISGRGYSLPSLMLLISITMPILTPFLFWGMGYFNIGYVAPLTIIGSNKAYLLGIMPFVWWYWYKNFKYNVIFKMTHEGADEDKKIHFNKVILAIKTVGFYLFFCLIPFKLTFFHSFAQACAGNDIMKARAYTIKDKFFWIGLGAIGIFIYLCTKGWSITTYGLLWFFISIAPFSNFRRIQQEIAERYVYLPNIGLMLALASLISTYPVIIAIFLTLYITRLAVLYNLYKDDYWLVETSTYEDQTAWYAWHMRGFKRWDNQSYREALTMWVMAKLLDPKEFKVLMNIAIVLKLLKKHDEAEAYLKEAEKNIIPGQEKEAKELIANFRKGSAQLLL